MQNSSVFIPSATTHIIYSKVLNMAHFVATLCSHAIKVFDRVTLFWIYRYNWTENIKKYEDVYGSCENASLLKLSICISDTSPYFVKDGSFIDSALIC